MDHRKLGVLFIHGQLRTGGIETLILRLARAASKQGIDLKVMVRTETGSPIEAEVAALADLLILGKNLWTGLDKVRQANLKGLDVIYVCNSESLILGCLIQAKFAPQARVVVGVYHSFEFCGARQWKRYKQVVSERIINRLPAENLVFMSEASQAMHAQRLGLDLSRSSVHPIPIEIPDGVTPETRLFEPGKIVSVGRLVDFKAYALVMLDVLVDLRHRGIRPSYHIYGDGPLKETIARRITHLGLGEQVVMHGEVPYARMQAAIQDSWLFVGMGTSVIEAAALGIPSLVAIESSTLPETYGYFSNVDGLNVGEIDAQLPKLGIADVIAELHAAAPAHYARLSEEARRKAEKFTSSALLPKWKVALQATTPFDYPITRTHMFGHALDVAFWRVAVRLGIQDPAQLRYVVR